ncbi:hypothetical protein [Streptomyces sp. NPDC046727]|uniref:hypothetical protein n=1 Tax=Streptomyces sp. NPDC046727 TaxID=3155373 RepID=UPI0033C7AC41
MGERYAEGRGGALLPEENLRNVEPLSLAQETLRLSVRLSLASLGALGGMLAVYPLLTHFGVPDGLRGWCYGVAGLVPSLLIAGPRQVLAFLNVLP